jgi:hypothetical protein
MSDTSKSPDAPAGLPPRCLRFYPATCFAREFIKKITHPYPLRFLFPCRSALRLPHPGRGHALPSLLPRAPSAAARSRPVTSASCLLPSRVLMLVVLTPPVACRLPDRPKPSVGGAGGGGAHAGRWCWMLVVLTCHHSPLAPTPTAAIDRLKCPTMARGG